MTDDLAAVLAEIREREEASSRGPWVHDPGYGYDSVTGRITLEAVTGPWTLEDLEFIAHARADVPRLLTAVDAVLALHPETVMEFDNPVKSPFSYCARCSGHPAWPCPEVAAVMAALTGKGENGVPATG